MHHFPPGSQWHNIMKANHPSLPSNAGCPLPGPQNPICMDTELLFGFLHKHNMYALAVPSWTTCMQDAHIWMHQYYYGPNSMASWTTQSKVLVLKMSYLPRWWCGWCVCMATIFIKRKHFLLMIKINSLQYR